MRSGGGAWRGRGLVGGWRGGGWGYLKREGGRRRRGELGFLKEGRVWGAVEWEREREREVFFWGEEEEEERRSVCSRIERETELFFEVMKLERKRRRRRRRNEGRENESHRERERALLLTVPELFEVLPV